MKIFTVPSRELIATGYHRIVVGKRGPYVEFSWIHIPEEVIDNSIFIPKDQLWRFHSTSVYYYEYRTVMDNVKIYYQKRTVNYADYKIGMIYISPYCLMTPNSSEINDFKPKGRI